MSAEPEVLRDRYVLVAELGRGGMGVVWRAFDQLLKRFVAIKVIDLGTNQGLALRTVREAQITAMINHPNIVKIHDIFQEGDQFYAVMELIDGVGLDTLIAKRSLDPPSIRRIMLAIASALSVAHGLGVSHRDVKPQNILVDRGGRAHLVDFGISRTTDHTRITQEGAVIGTLSYMPPEVAEANDATFASDMWALGATIYCCFEGRPPFVRADNRINMQALFNGVAPPPTRAGDLTGLINHLLLKDPAARPTARDVVAFLERPRQDPPPVPHIPQVPEIPPTDPPRDPTGPRQPRTRNRLMVLVAIAIIVIAGVTTALVLNLQGTPGGGGSDVTSSQSGSIPQEPPGSPAIVPVSEVNTDGQLVAPGVTGSAADPRGTGSAECPSTTTIAMAGALSGPNAALGMNELNGAALAVEQHNEANPGCQVLLKSFDTEGDPATATALASQAIDDPDIIAMVGPTFSAESQAMGGVLASSGLLWMSPSATSPALTTQGWKTFFRGLGTDALLAPAMANYLTGPLGFGKVCVISDSAFGAGLAEEVISLLGSAASSACEAGVASGTTDFSSVVAEVVGEEPDAVVYIGSMAESVPLVQQLRNAGSDATFLTGEESLDAQFVELGGEAVNGSYLFCPCAGSTGSFAADYLGRYGTVAGNYAVEAYDLTTIMLSGIDSGVDDRAGMVDYVKNYSGQGFARYYEWGTTGELREANVWVYRVEE